MSKERLTIWRIVGAISVAMFLRTLVGTGSRSQDEFDELERRLVISRMVGGVKDSRLGGSVGGGMSAEVEAGFECRLKCSLEMLSVKYVANS